MSARGALRCGYEAMVEGSGFTWLLGSPRAVGDGHPANVGDHVPRRPGKLVHLGHYVVEGAQKPFCVLATDDQRREQFDYVDVVSRDLGNDVMLVEQGNNRGLR